MESTTKTHRLIILSGPSCVGKSPLAKALRRFYPDLDKALQPLVLYNSRSPRPGETDGKDYHFRSEGQIKALASKPGFVVLDVRGDTQALDVNELKAQLNDGDVFFEGNPFIGELLLTSAELADIDKLSIFMAPLSRDELLELKQADADLSTIVTDIMRHKLLRRTRKQKGELSLKDLENIERRASSAWKELAKASLFTYVLPNHDGEDSENWDAFYYPVGDARHALLDFVSLLQGKPTRYAEQWEETLVD